MTRRIALVVAFLLAALVAWVLLRPEQHRATRRATTVAPSAHPPSSSRSWPEYGGDPQRSHAAASAPAPPFRVAWKDVGDWSLIEFPPVVEDGRVFVGTNHGLLLALDAATGRRLWQRSLGRCIASSPAIVGAVLVVGVMARPPLCDRDVESSVAGFDVASGRTLWRRTERGPVETSPLVVGHDVVVGSWSGRVESIDARTGSLRWSVATRGPVKAGAALAGTSVVVGSYDGTISALDANDGRVRWRTDVGAPFYATPSVVDGRVIAATTDGVVRAFAAGTGAPLWSRRIGRFVYSPAALADGRAFVGSYDHHLYALDVRTGDVLWRSTAPGAVSGAPTVLGGLVYFSSCGSCSSFESNSKARRTFAVDAASGEQAWTFPDGEYSSVVTDGTQVYLTGYTTLYALR